MYTCIKTDLYIKLTSDTKLCNLGIDFGCFCLKGDIFLLSMERLAGND